MKTPQNFLFLVMAILIAFVIFLAWLQVLHAFPAPGNAGIFSWLPAFILALAVLAGIRRLMSGSWM